MIWTEIQKRQTAEHQHKELRNRPHEEKTTALVCKSSFVFNDVDVDQYGNVTSILHTHTHTQAWTHTKEVITRPSECIMISHLLHDGRWCSDGKKEKKLPSTKITAGTKLRLWCQHRHWCLMCIICTQTHTHTQGLLKSKSVNMEENLIWGQTWKTKLMMSSL